MADLFLDLDEPAAPAATPAYEQKTRTWSDHICEQPGCYRWGCNGWMPQGIETSQWWCVEHTPQWWKDGGPLAKRGA